MVPIHFAQISDPASMTSSGERSQSTSLDNSNKPVEQCERSVDRVQSSISYLGLKSVSLDHRLVLFASHKYRLEFINSKLVGV